MDYVGDSRFSHRFDLEIDLLDDTFQLILRRLPNLTPSLIVSELPFTLDNFVKNCFKTLKDL